MSERRKATLQALLAVASLTMGAAVGAGLYESVILTPVWSAAPPASFEIIQPDTGVPLQSFWMPLHGVLTVAILGALVVGWRDRAVRWLVLVALGAYAIMRAWSFAYFIPEMLAFQAVPLDAAPTEALRSRVADWVALTWLRTPLDFVAALAFLAALGRGRRSGTLAGPPVRRGRFAAGKSSERG